MKSFLENKGQKAIMINGVEDHVHLLISMNGTKSVSELMRDMKETTTKFINEKNLTDSRFAWQSGYSAFSLSKKSSSRVANYILNQEEHHGKEEFKDEYKRMLTEHEVIFREEYLFEDAPE
jgi:REP element-mobilizing transposase RayT